MANADLTRLMNLARVRTPGALDSALQLELFSAVDEFLRGSYLWKEAIPFPTTIGETLYELEPEESTSQILALIGVEDASEIPVYATMATVGELVLNTEPATVETLTATVALTVSDPVDTDGYPRFPAWILDKYRDCLFDGLLGRMMSQPAKPYSSERLAIYHLRRFRNATAQARTDAAHKHVHNAQAWRFPGGWR